MKPLCNKVEKQSPLLLENGIISVEEQNRNRREGKKKKQNQKHYNLCWAVSFFSTK